MIKKSYLIEDNIKLLKNNLVLFYGENIGLIDDLKQKIKKNFSNKRIIKLNQEEILNNKNILSIEIKNVSLFEDTKIIFINNVNDKIFDLVQSLIPHINSNKIFLFANVLEKKTKLRKFFEISTEGTVIPCYKDNKITLRKLIQIKLKSYSGVTPEIINFLIETCNLDRSKLNNELEKIKMYFSEKILDLKKIEHLININVNEDFEIIKDYALKGNKFKTNVLLSNTIFEIEKTPFYINLINQRLNKLKIISLLPNNTNLSLAIDNIKPPIFWKDKQNFKDQIKLWNTKKIKTALQKIYDFEISFKSNSIVNKNLLLKKLILDICLMANA